MLLLGALAALGLGATLYFTASYLAPQSAQGLVTSTRPDSVLATPKSAAPEVGARVVTLPPPPSETELLAQQPAVSPSVASAAAPTAAAAPAPRRGAQHSGAVALAAASPSACADTCQGPSRSMTQALHSNARAARSCYQSALKQGSNASGKLTVRVRVAGSGKLCSAHVESDTLGDPTVSACVAARFRRSRYPQNPHGCSEARVPISFLAQ